MYFDEPTLRTIARYNIRKNPDEITDEDLMTYFNDLRKSYFRDNEPDIPSIVKLLNYDLSILDSTSRVMDFAQQIEKLLLKYCLEELFEKNPKAQKRFLKLVITKVKPASLSSSLANHTMWVDDEVSLRRSMHFYR